MFGLYTWKKENDKIQDLIQKIQNLQVACFVHLVQKTKKTFHLLIKMIWLNQIHLNLEF